MRQTPASAAGGTAVLQGPGGRRRVPLTDFWTGFFETAMSPDEMVVELRVPRTGPAGWGYEKFTRRENDWPIVAAAAVDGRVALASMGGTVLRATATEEAKDKFRVAFERLPKREREVAVLLYVKNLTLREIGDILGVSESRVCQIHSQLKRTLKAQLADNAALFSAVS